MNIKNLFAVSAALAITVPRKTKLLPQQKSLQK